MAAAAAAAAALRVVCRVVWTGAGITGCFPEMAALEDEDACSIEQVYYQSVLSGKIIIVIIILKFCHVSCHNNLKLL